MFIEISINMYLNFRIVQSTFLIIVYNNIFIFSMIPDKETKSKSIRSDSSFSDNVSFISDFCISKTFD